MSTSVLLTVTVNGTLHRLEVPTSLTLADLLREWLDLSGTKVACDQGVCGACTVLVDDAPVTSCITFAFAVDGTTVRTIESVAGEGGCLDPVQTAFHEAGVPQCGFCTPGMVMLAEALKIAERTPSSETIDRWMSANICRCSGYQVLRRAFSAVVGGT
jgi:aerobic-type carbon monoxide dehydrogenase small subunit (CoxS/CutS family)